MPNTEMGGDGVGRIGYDIHISAYFLHATLMTLAFIVLLPLGMVLGLRKNNMHGPVLLCAALCALVAWIAVWLPHSTKRSLLYSDAKEHQQRLVQRYDGRVHGYSIGHLHRVVGQVLLIVFAVQVLGGVYRKLTKRPGEDRARSMHGRLIHIVLVTLPSVLHRTTGKVLWVVGIAQVMLGMAASTRSCHEYDEDNYGEAMAGCKLHYSISTIFICQAVLGLAIHLRFLPNPGAVASASVLSSAKFDSEPLPLNFPTPWTCISPSALHSLVLLLFVAPWSLLATIDLDYGPTWGLVMPAGAVALGLVGLYRARSTGQELHSVCAITGVINAAWCALVAVSLWLLEPTPPSAAGPSIPHAFASIIHFLASVGFALAALAHALDAVILALSRYRRARFQTLEPEAAPVTGDDHGIRISLLDRHGTGSLIGFLAWQLHLVASMIYMASAIGAVHRFLGSDSTSHDLVRYILVHIAVAVVFSIWIVYLLTNWQPKGMLPVAGASGGGGKGYESLEMHGIAAKDAEADGLGHELDHAVDGR